MSLLKILGSLKMLNYVLCYGFGDAQRLQSIWLVSGLYAMPFSFFYWRAVGTWNGHPLDIQRSSLPVQSTTSLTQLTSKTVRTVVPKLIFLSTEHIPEGEQRASQPLFPLKNKSRWGLCWWNLACPYSAVLCPCGFPSWKSQNRHGGLPPSWTWPDLSGCLLKGIFMKTLFYFLFYRIF